MGWNIGQPIYPSISMKFDQFVLKSLKRIKTDVKMIDKQI